LGGDHRIWFDWATGFGLLLRIGSLIHMLSFYTRLVIGELILMARFNDKGFEMEDESPIAKAEENHSPYGYETGIGRV
jgi:hypothetical protein